MEPLKGVRSGLRRPGENSRGVRERSGIPDGRRITRGKHGPDFPRSHGWGQRCVCALRGRRTKALERGAPFDKASLRFSRMRRISKRPGTWFRARTGSCRLDGRVSCQVDEKVCCAESEVGPLEAVSVSGRAGTLAGSGRRRRTFLCQVVRSPCGGRDDSRGCFCVRCGWIAQGGLDGSTMKRLRRGQGRAPAPRQWPHRAAASRVIC